MDTNQPRVSIPEETMIVASAYVGSFWQNERTGEGGSEMIYESGSEKEKKVQLSDRTSDELGKGRERERGGKSGGVRRKGASERDKYIYILYARVYMWVYGRENERGTERGRERERDRAPSTPILLPPTFSISSTASSSFSSLSPLVPDPSFSQAESNQYFGKVRGRSTRL